MVPLLTVMHDFHSLEPLFWSFPENRQLNAFPNEVRTGCYKNVICTSRKLFQRSDTALMLPAIDTHICAFHCIDNKNNSDIHKNYVNKKLAENQFSANFCAYTTHTQTQRTYNYVAHSACTLTPLFSLFLFRILYYIKTI